MRRLVLLACLALAACGHSPSKPPLTSNDTEAPPEAPRHELVGHGLSAEFPAPPTQRAFQLGDNSQTNGFVLSATHEGMDFMVLRVKTEGTRRDDDESWLDRIIEGAERVDDIKDVTLEGFIGKEYWGISSRSRQIGSRVFIAGDSALVIQVEAEPGELDEAITRSFLDSLRFEMPWSVYVSTEGQFSVAAPDIRVELSPDQFAAPDAQGRVFYVGGPERLAFVVVMQPIDPLATENASTAELLELGVQRMTDVGTRIQSQHPIEMDGAQGRDILGTADETVIRTRLLVTQHFVYVLSVTALSKEAVMTNEATRFLDSLQWF